MDTLNSYLIPLLAAEDFSATAKQGALSFLRSGAGSNIIRLMAVIGLILVIIAAFKAGGQVLSGKIGPAVKILVGALFAVAFLFNPGLLVTLLEWFASLIGSIIDSGQQVTQ